MATSTSQYEQLSSDQLIDLYCNGLLEPALSEVSQILFERGVLNDDWRKFPASWVEMGVADVNQLPDLAGDEYGRVCEVYDRRQREAMHPGLPDKLTLDQIDELRRQREINIGGQSVTLSLDQINELLVRAWKPSAVTWPEKIQWKKDDNEDVLSPSPDGRSACVVHSTQEIRMGWYVGRLALLKGPPERPAVLLQAPASLLCCPRVQWLGHGRYCAVETLLLNPRTDQVERLAFTFLDITERAFTHSEPWPGSYTGQKFTDLGDRCVIRSQPDESGARQVQTVVFDQLRWRPWRLLTGISENRNAR